MAYETAFERARKLCLRLPRVTERASHGSPGFFIDAKKPFVYFRNDHHGDGVVGMWCAAPEGAQTALLASDPEQYYRPAYVGGRGWIGVHLDKKPDWKTITAIINDAYDAVAPPRAPRTAPARKQP